MNVKKEELFPWQKETRKTKNKEIGNLPEKTNVKSKARSKPSVGGQEYLNLYLMMKEKERLEKFGQVVVRMHRQTAKSWRELNKEITETEKTLPSAETREMKTKKKVGKIEKRTPKKPMKTMVLDY